MLLTLVLATAAAASAGSGNFTIEHIVPFDYYDGNGWSATGHRIEPLYCFDGTDTDVAISAAPVNGSTPFTT